MGGKLHKITGFEGDLSVFSDRIEVNRSNIETIPIADIENIQYDNLAIEIFHAEKFTRFEIPPEKEGLAVRIVERVKGLIPNSDDSASPISLPRVPRSKHLGIIGLIALVLLIAVAFWWATTPSEQEHPEPALMMSGYLDNWMAQDWDGMALLSFGNFDASAYEELLGEYKLSTWKLQYEDKKTSCEFDLVLTINGQTYDTTARISYYNDRWNLVMFDWFSFLELEEAGYASVNRPL